MRFLLKALTLITIGLTVAGCSSPSPAASTVQPAATQKEGTSRLSLTSDAFRPGEAIPARYTCDGENISPKLSWTDAPSNTASFALIVDDPDAPRGTFTHWVLYNLPSSVQGLSMGMPKTELLENGGVQGRNDSGQVGYMGPCPPAGNPHHYQFSLYALDSQLNLKPGASKQEVLDAIKGHVAGQTMLVGTYRKAGS